MTPNDVYDFDHATAALPYCDAFITDKKTWYHVTNNNTSLDRRYGCKTGKKLEELYTFNPI